MNDKELLLKDLCARLPYNVKYHYIDAKNNDRIDTFKTIVLHRDKTELIFMVCGDFSVQHTQDDPLVKPYLFPLSSMTEEQLNDFYKTIRPIIEASFDAYKEDKTEYDRERPITLNDIKIDIVAVNWMLKNHFDINGLIPMGLAIDCTNLNIY